MADNLTQVLTQYTVYIDSSSLMHGSMEFFKISLYNVLRSTNRKLKVVDFVIKDLQKKQFSDNEKYAVKALKIIEFYREKGLIEDVVSRRSENGKILDVIYNNRQVDNNDVVLITDNKAQANEIVTSLSNTQAVDFGHQIAAVRLINGPALWDVKTVKPRVMPIGRQKPLDYSKGFGFKKEEPAKEPKVAPYSEPVKKEPVPMPKKEEPVRDPRRMYREEPSNEPVRDPRRATPSFEQKEQPIKEPVQTPEQATPEAFAPKNSYSRVKRNKLVVSLVVDNSSSLTDEREAKLKDALAHFNARLEASDISRDLDLAVFGFDGFSPRTIKGFDEQLNINKFDNGGIQVLGKSIDLGMKELAERQKLYASHNIETHKPWIIVLADGDAYGDLSDTADKLKKVLKERKVTYFPFSLNAGQLSDSLDPITRLKMFLKVRDDMFVELFDFIFDTLETRINTPKDDLMRLDKKAIAGFIAR